MRAYWVMVFWVAASVARASDRAVEYTVRLTAPQTQVVQIDATFPDVTGDALEVHLPVWRPGLYLVLDNAGTLRRVWATNARGEALPIEKTRKSSWRVDTSSMPAGDVTVSCEIYANSIGNRTRHVDDTHAFLSGSSVFMFSETTRDNPVEVAFEAPGGEAIAPDDWRVASGMRSVDERRVRAPSYDILVDSPIDFGLQERIEFEAGGAEQSYVIWGRFDGDAEQLAEDTAAIVEAQRAIFGELPYERYVFLTHSAPGLRGGTEHYNSTVLSVDPRVWTDEERYEGFLSLVAHEHFHTWNVKRFRPSEIDTYEYLQESYTRLLWLVEGTTSYYDELTLPRAGVIEADDYLERLSEAIDSYRRTPGRLVQPLDESSYDAWIKLFHRGSDRGPDRANSTISFYQKGALVSLALDLRIREMSNHTRSLDDVMRRLYERFPLGEGGYTDGDVRRIVREVAPAFDVDAFFASAIEGVDEIDFESVVAIVGLELVAPADEDEPAWYVGVDVGSDGVVQSVRSDGPAYAAGLMARDRLVAVNGLRVDGISTGDFAELVEHQAPEGPMRIAFFRNDELRLVRIEAVERPGGEWSLRRLIDATPTQRRAYEAWIGAEWEQPEPEDTDTEEDDES